MKFFTETLSCSNRNDEVVVIKDKMKRAGFQEVTNVEQSDIIIIYTCGSTHMSVSRSMKRISSFLDMYPEKKMLVCGCLPATNIDTLKQIYKGHLCTPSDFISFRELLDLEINREDFRNVIVQQNEENMSEIVVVKGCIRNCSYCSIKWSVGSLFSKSPEQIIRAIKEECILKGHRKIKLLGDSIGDYGLDIGTTFGELLEKIDFIDEPITIHIRDLHPVMFLRFYDIIKFMSEKGKFSCLQIPIQSGNPEILNFMKRHVRIDSLKEKLIELKRLGVMLQTDIIVGFPGETTEQFNDTVEFLKDIEFDHISVNVYSDQPNTPSSKMTPKINKKEIFSRCMTLQECGIMGIDKEYMEFQLGYYFKVSKLKHEFMSNL